MTLLETAALNPEPSTKASSPHEPLLFRKPAAHVVQLVDDVQALQLAGQSTQVVLTRTVWFGQALTAEGERMVNHIIRVSLFFCQECV